MDFLQGIWRNIGNCRLGKYFSIIYILILMRIHTKFECLKK